jgi:hypothetical protein
MNEFVTNCKPRHPCSPLVSFFLIFDIIDERTILFIRLEYFELIAGRMDNVECVGLKYKCLAMRYIHFDTTAMQLYSGCITSVMSSFVVLGNRAVQVQYPEVPAVPVLL